MPNQEHTYDQLVALMQATATPEEIARFEASFEALPEAERKRFLEGYLQTYLKQPGAASHLTAETESGALKDLWQRIDTAVGAGKDIGVYSGVEQGIDTDDDMGDNFDMGDSAGAGTAVVHRVHFLKTAWFRYAAILLLIAGTATFLYLNNRPQKEIALTTTGKSTGGSTDVQPGGNKAILTLADGSQIVLDSAANGQLASQGATTIVKTAAGALAYDLGPGGSDLTGAARNGGPVGINTISTPKGGQYQVSLPDGSRVWLNAASSIRFPTAFGKERMVDVTGEAYFEIAADKNKPFIVNADRFKVAVLGTAFNINAYSDEPRVSTTLVNGSVSVHTSRDQRTLVPGQQAQLNNDGNAPVLDVRATDTDKAIAWKNGVFNFNESGLEEVMRQLARWYDIEVVYEHGIPNVQFGGKLDKGQTLASVLKGLSGFGIRYRIESGKRLVILP